MLRLKMFLCSVANLFVDFLEWGYLPRYMAFVRHGLSDANKERALVEDGDQAEYSAQYLETPDREFRLEAEVGREQPKVAGAWIRENCPRFTYATASDHVRAYETAGLLGLCLRWFIDCFYGERYWGSIDVGDPVARKRFLDLRERDPMHGTPPGGERFLSARHRARVLLERAARHFSLGNFLGVFHGEFIEAIICEILHLTTEEYKEFRKSELGAMENCQVVEFTRVNPVTGKVSRRIEWMRSSNPYLEIFGEWVKIDDLPFARKSFTDEQLLKRAGTYPNIDRRSASA